MKAMPDRDIGRLIRKRRQALGMRQHELAAKVGVDRSAVSNWERGQHFPLRYQGALEEILGIDLDDDGTQGLPPIVAANWHIEQVRTIWNLPDEKMAPADRLAWIRAWLEKHPQPAAHRARPEA